MLCGLPFEASYRPNGQPDRHALFTRLLIFHAIIITSFSWYAKVPASCGGPFHLLAKAEGLSRPVFCKSQDSVGENGIILWAPPRKSPSVQTSCLLRSLSQALPLNPEIDTGEQGKQLPA